MKKPNESIYWLIKKEEKKCNTKKYSGGWVSHDML